MGSSTQLEERLEIAGPNGSETRSALPASTQQQELLFRIGPGPVRKDSRRTQTGLPGFRLLWTT